jgi:hypothetical protein
VNADSVRRKHPISPTYTVHLEDPPGSGLSACSGLPFYTEYVDRRFPHELCTGCSRVVRNSKSQALTTEEDR